MTFATLRALHTVIGAAIEDIERIYRKHSVDYPSLDEPYYSTAQHTPEEELAESLKEDPAVVAASMRIVAASAQLSTTVNKPWSGLMKDMLWGEFSSAIRLLEVANIVEILREAGPGGLHVQDIHGSVLELRTNSKTAAPAGTVPLTPARLSHILRLLATGHYLREVQPDVFANNRASSYIDSGKSMAQLREAPKNKYNDTNGVAAYVALIGDEGLKSTSCMTEWALPERRATVVPTRTDANPGSGDARAPHRELEAQTHSTHAEDADVDGDRCIAPLNLVFNTHLRYFPWLELPENEGRLARFGVGMVGVRRFESQDQILQGFSWDALPHGAVLVDVGGGIGSQSILVAQAHTHIRAIVEDREQVVSTARSAWGPQYAHLFESGRMSWRTRDFFDPWPALDALPSLDSGAESDPPGGGPVVFLLRMVLHNWEDEDCKRGVYFPRSSFPILCRLRAAAGPHTKLLLGEVLLDNTCTEKTGYDDDPEAAAVTRTSSFVTKPGGDSGSSPLLPNLGAGNILPYLMDILMMGLFGAKERTVDEMTALTLSAGWKIVDIRRRPGSIVSYTTAVPV